MLKEQLGRASGGRFIVGLKNIYTPQVLKDIFDNRSYGKKIARKIFILRRAMFFLLLGFAIE